MLLALLAALATSPLQCAPVEVSAEGAEIPATFGADSVKQVQAMFAQAYKKACAGGFLKDKPLVPADSRTPGRIFLLNAPEANVLSIYTAQDGRTLLEYYFVTPDGATHVPPADEMDEAIYCAAIGATEAEQEESGRCLPD
jgi:hypothetical protein